MERERREEREVAMERERSGQRAELSAQRQLRSRPHRDVKSLPVNINLNFDLLTNLIHPHSGHSTDELLTILLYKSVY